MLWLKQGEGLPPLKIFLALGRSDLICIGRESLDIASTLTLAANTRRYMPTPATILLTENWSGPEGYHDRIYSRLYLIRENYDQ